MVGFVGSMPSPASHCHCVLRSCSPSRSPGAAAQARGGGGGCRMRGVSVACPRPLVGGTRGQEAWNRNAGGDRSGGGQARLVSPPWPAGLTVAVGLSPGVRATRR